MKLKLFLAICIIMLISPALTTLAQEKSSAEIKAEQRYDKIVARLTIKDSIVTERHHGLRIGYGAVAPFYQFRQIDPASYSLQHYYRGREFMSGVFFAEYSYRPLRWLEVGANVSYINFSRLFYDRITTRKIGHHTLNTVGLAAKVRFSFLTRPVVRLYSSLALGAAIGFEQIKIDRQFQNSTTSYFNGSFTYFGITVGRRLYGFAEFSVGTMGLVNFGIGYRFKTN